MNQTERQTERDRETERQRNVDKGDEVRMEGGERRRRRNNLYKASKWNIGRWRRRGLGVWVRVWMQRALGTYFIGREDWEMEWWWWGEGGEGVVGRRGEGVRREKRTVNLAALSLRRQRK